MSNVQMENTPTETLARSGERDRGEARMLKVWMNGELVDQPDAKVSVYDHGLLYGDGCFEGIRVYNGRVFKLASHLKRMYASAEKIRLTPAYSIDEVDRAIRHTLDVNGITDGYIRLVFTRGVGSLGLHPFRCEASGTIIITDKIQLYPDELYESGMRVVVAKRPRVPTECLDPSVKSLNYLNNILAKVEAIDADVLEAIMLNVNGMVAECTGDNLFMVKDGQIITPATEAGFLHGITRAFVISDLAPAIGKQVEERLFGIDELMTADEIFLTGTAAEVIGVTHVGDQPIGDGAVGQITRALRESFQQRVSRDAPED